MKKIVFNQPYLAGKELDYIREAIAMGKISGDGNFTHRCHQFFCQRFGFKKALLTHSCTAALEMAAILCEIRPGDEVIVPSYTFPSTANAFVLRGAKIVFADSGSENPNIDVNHLEQLVTKKTKIIVPVHYAGLACEMDQIMKLANERNLFVVEDAAQAIDSYYNGVSLGQIGHFGTFSFHETKNISSGEGGLLAVNDPKFFKRAEIIREKGTNRSAFFRGEVDKYGWVDIGSSYLPSDLTAAFLLAQLEKIQQIQEKRVRIWNIYYERLKELESASCFSLLKTPDYATNNAHLFSIICRSLDERQSLIAFLKDHGISAVFHYLPLHQSPYYQSYHDGRELPNAERYSNCLLRLPLHCNLSEEDVEYIVDRIYQFFRATAINEPPAMLGSHFSK